ncbi:MAG: hypothetical protein H0X15_03430 [Acidobacteria bacterium]|nr:hypothetical protein [Acidobacteriota bacterium]
MAVFNKDFPENEKPSNGRLPVLSTKTYFLCAKIAVGKCCKAFANDEQGTL